MNQLLQIRLKYLFFPYALLFLIIGCSKPNYEKPSEVCKVYIESFNDRDLKVLRSLTLEKRSDADIDKIFTMWKNLNSRVNIKSIKESNRTESEIRMDMVLQYNMTVESKNFNEEDYLEFILKKDNNQWKVERGLL